MRNKTILIFSLFLILTCILSWQVVLAQPSDPPNPGATSDTPKLEDPLGYRSLPEIIGQGIKVGLGIVGAVALALFVYGGFTWMLAGGNAQKVQKGREILVWATIGLIVIFTSYAVLNFVLGAITGSG